MSLGKAARGLIDAWDRGEPFLAHIEALRRALSAQSARGASRSVHEALSRYREESVLAESPAEQADADKRLLATLARFRARTPPQRG